ncbi:AI-2E family transporter [Rhodobacterales bacterium HKCCE2091]|nr:AI-2E family transporter [Rhodobacterales bacterium HKCCE2091]
MVVSTSQRTASVLLTVFLVFAMLYVAEDILAPLTLAVVAGVVLSPISRFWTRLGFRPVVGALATLLTILVLVAAIIFALQPLARQMIDQAPQVLREFDNTLGWFRRISHGIEQAASDLNEAVSANAAIAQEAGNAESPAEESPIPTVEEALWLAPAIVAKFLIFVGGLFFFTLARRDIYAGLSRLLTPLGRRPVLAGRLISAEARVSRYFLTITAINATLGICTAIGLKTLGLPNAMFWGLAAMLLNYILYIGPACVVAGLLFAGVASFNGALSFVPAAMFAFFNMMEGQFVTPAFVGHHMKINPFLVFLALIVGLWMWGPIGGVVAIPIVVWLLHVVRPTAVMPTPAVERVRSARNARRALRDG